MHSGALRALEFDRIVDAVGRLAQTPPGAVRLAGLSPLPERGAVESALDATAEMVRFLGDAHVGLQAPAELDAIVDGLAVEGRALEPLQLTGLASFLASVEATRGAILRARAAFPILRVLAESAAAFEDEIADIRRKIDPSGEVADNASPSCRRCATACASSGRASAARSIVLRGRTSKYLQQQISRTATAACWSCAQAPHRDSGIVRQLRKRRQLFLEPLSTVRSATTSSLEQQEAEVRRILLALSDAFRRRDDDLQRTLGAATEPRRVAGARGFSILVGGISENLRRRPSGLARRDTRC